MHSVLYITTISLASLRTSQRTDLCRHSCQTESDNRKLLLLLLLFNTLLIYLLACLFTFYFLLNYLLQLSCHLMAVVLTLVQTKQIRINIHNRNNTKTQYRQYKNTVQTTQNTVNTSTHITKTPTQFSQHPHITTQVQTTTVTIQ